MICFTFFTGNRTKGGAIMDDVEVVILLESSAFFTFPPLAFLPLLTSFLFLSVTAAMSVEFLGCILPGTGYVNVTNRTLSLPLFS